MHAVVLTLIAAPLGLALLAWALSGAPKWAGRVALAGPVVVLALGVRLWGSLGDAPELLPAAWFPALGITAGLRVDRLGAFFVLLVGGIGLAVFQYARRSLGAKATGGFWALLLAFTGSMVGIVLSDSLVLLYLFWEATTVTSALLIGRDGTVRAERRGAIQAFLVTAGGGLAMLGGIGLLVAQEGTDSLAGLAARSEQLVASPAHVPALLLLCAGAFAKSAQFPLHFWLPAAMTAPAPVSAYLHSATLVKAGIFLLARLAPVFGTSPLWTPLLATVGLATLLVGGWSGLRERDLKRLLAHATVAYLGLLTAIIGLWPGELALLPIHVANHAVYKASLFLVAGRLEKTAGTRDLDTLSVHRWARGEPVLTVLAALGALSLAGVPLLFGFASKEAVLEPALASAPYGARAALLAGLTLSAALALKIFVPAFVKGGAPPAPAQTSSRWLVAIPAVLLVAQLAGGLFPAQAVRLLAPGTSWPGGPAIWHELDLLLLLSAAIYLGAALLFAGWPSLARARQLPAAEAVAERLAAAVLSLCARAGSAMQAGGHPRYVAVLILVACAAAAGATRIDAFPGAGSANLERGGRAAEPVAWAGSADEQPRAAGAFEGAGFALVPAIAIAAGAVGAVVLPGRLARTILVAVSGYGVALLYVLFRAPDLALTQVLVETVSLLLVLLFLSRMPRRAAERRTSSQRAIHAGLATAAGLLGGLLAYTAGAARAPSPAGAEAFARASPDAGGLNAVNVVLVDFRAGDTLGEIVVLAIAAIGTIVLMRSPAAAGRN